MCCVGLDLQFTALGFCYKLSRTTLEVLLNLFQQQNVAVLI